jgi:phospholipase/carboxylesterase
MAEARDRIIDAMQKLECDPGKTVIGGFSQGAMLATEIALHHKEYLAGLLIFSGTLVNRTGWESMLKTKFVDKQKTLRFHQSHGRLDPVLPFQAAERLYGLLTANGAQGELHAFEGQHEIPAAVIDATNRWLGALFS